MMHHRNLLLWISISTAASVQINPRETIIDAKRNDAINTNNLKQRRLQSSSSCEPTQSLWTLSLTTDQNPEETSWRLVQLESIYYEASIDPENPDYADIVTQQGAARKGKVIASGPPKSSGGNETAQYYAPETTYTGSLCLDGGYIYVMRMKDAGGDGLGSVSDGNEDGTTGWSVIVSTDNGDGSDEFFEAFGNDAANFKTKDFEFVVDSIIVTTVEPTASPMTKVPTAATAEPMVAINGTESPTKAPTASTNEPTTKKPTASPTAGLTEKVSTGPETVVSFIVMGDVPYYINHRYCLNQQLRELDQSAEDFLFMVHVGDIKSGQTRECEPEIYSDVAEIFSNKDNALNYDTRDIFFIVGDNDWCDCNDPESALSYWMNNFGNGQKTNGLNTGPNPYGFGTMSDSNIVVEYDFQGNSQSSSNYPTSASNFAFFHNLVLFVGINQVGGSSIGDESERVANNFEWVKSNMEYYAERGMKTLVVFAHADMGNARSTYFGNPFQKLLRNQYPDMLVVYIHGDGHEFNVGYADSSNRNLVQIEVDSGDAADPIMISVVRDASKELDKMVVDRRGGQYYDLDCDPDNRDKTWSSNSW